MESSEKRKVAKHSQSMRSLTQPQKPPIKMKRKAQFHSVSFKNDGSVSISSGNWHQKQLRFGRWQDLDYDETE